MVTERKENFQLEHVLVVEDDDTWRDLFARSFQRRGIKATIVGSAVEALELLEKGEINRVITDGLNDNWWKVAKAAHELGLSVKLVSAEERYQLSAHEMGIEFINKREAVQLRVRDQL